MKKRSGKVLLGMALASSALLLSGCKKAEEQAIPTTVYGPPGWFGEEEDLGEVPEPTATPDGFDPEENIPEDVYGPPSYWE